MNSRLALLCVLFALMLAGGQLLFKLGANAISSRASGSLLGAILSPYLMSAVALYGLTTILWIYILSRAPLSAAYPFSLLGSVLVPVLAVVFLQEPLDGRSLVGLAVTILGLCIANVR